MRIEERLREAYERTRSGGPAEAGAYDRFLRRRARSVRTVTAAAVVLMLALAGLAPRLLGSQDRGVVRPPRPVPLQPAPRPVPPAPPLMVRLTADGPQMRAVAFSPDGRTLAVAGRHSVSLWKLDRGTRTVLDTPKGPYASDAVAFAPDGRTLAVGAGNRVVLWDLASQTPRASLPLPTGMAGNLLGPLAFSPDGRVLAAVADGEILLAWDVARRAQLAIVPTGVSSISDLAFRANSRWVVVAGSTSGGAYRQGDPVPALAVIVDIPGRSTHPPVRFQAGLGSQPAVAFRRSGAASLAVVGDPQQRLAVLSVTPEAHLQTLAGRYPVTGVVLSRDGSLVAMASPVGEVTVWDFGRGVLRGPLPGIHPRRGGFYLSPQNAAFSRDGRRLAIADGTGSVFVWSMSDP